MWLRGHIYSGVDRQKYKYALRSATDLLNGVFSIQNPTCNRQKLEKNLKTPNNATLAWSPPQ